MKIKEFIELKIKNNSLYEKIYKSGEFTDSEFLYLFPNNQLKMHGLPLKRGGRKKKQLKRRIILSQPMFSIIEEVVETTFDDLHSTESPFFNNFVDFKNVTIGDKAVFIPELNMKEGMDFGRNCGQFVWRAISRQKPNSDGYYSQIKEKRH